MFLKTLKQQLKEQAADIRAFRAEVKQKQREGSGGNQWTLSCKSADFRYKHIAYCLLRGRAYEQIEAKVKDGNEPRWDRIDKLVAEGTTAIAAEREAWDAAQALRVG